MYVVGYGIKHLKIKRGDTRVLGQEVPEAENWKEHVLQSHLNLKHLMTQEEYTYWKKTNDKKQKELKARKDKERELRAARVKALEATRAKEEKASKKEASKSEKELPPEEVGQESPEKVEQESTGAALDLGALNKSQLKKLAKEHGLTVGGTKEQLLNRLQEQT